MRSKGWYGSDIQEIHTLRSSRKCIFSLAINILIRRNPVTREVFNKAMEILDKLNKKVDEAILQVEGYGLGKEGIGFAKSEDDEDGYGLG